MIYVVTMLWKANSHSYKFSRDYDETWVDKLRRGFDRNLTVPFQFVCFVDRIRQFDEPVLQLHIEGRKDYSAFSEPYSLGEPMILVGLDTVITGNVDHLAEYCLTEDKLALPRDPYKPERACNGVALVPKGYEDVADHRGENDMVHIRKFPHVFIDDLFPGHVVSYKGHVQKNGLGDARIIYFHGKPKPTEIDEPWIKESFY